jgi:hypothetical protein
MKATKESEAGQMPPTALIEAMMKFNEEMVKAGVLVGAEGLHPSAKGARICYSSKTGQRTVVDGPFAETKELIAGFWLIQTKSLEEAIAWMQRIPSVPGAEPSEDHNIEIRQVFEAADFGDSMTPGQLEKEEKLRRGEV